MSWKKLHVLPVLILALCPLKGQAQQTHKTTKHQLLSAIDVPLTTELVEKADLDVAYLLRVILSSNERLYTQGRAIAALGMRTEDEIGAHLNLIISGVFDHRLKQQAVRSLSQGWGRRYPQRALVVLGDQVARQSGDLQALLKQHFLKLQARIHRSGGPTSLK